MSGTSDLVVAAHRAEGALRDFIRAVDETGGVRLYRKTGLYAPVTVPDWVDLGEAYISACTVLGWPPEVRDDETSVEEDASRVGQNSVENPDAHLDLSDREYIELQTAYAGKSFVFHSPFADHPGWKDGDNGVLVRLIRVGTEGVDEANDLWVGFNARSGEFAQLWGGEAFTVDGEAVVVEQRLVNWSPGR